MPRKNTTLHLHSKLALEIKAAKKKMFQNHREGMSAREAADKFVIDMTHRFENVLPRGADRDPEQPGEQTGPETPDTGGYSLLSDKELELACTSLAEDLGGAYHVGLLILLLNHLVAVQVSGRSHPNLEGAVIDIQEALLRTNSHATAFAVESLAAKTGKHLTFKAQGIDDVDWNTGERRPASNDESVTVTLPNGKSPAHLARALIQILQNEQTPDDLREKIEDFACNAGNGNVSQFWSLPKSEEAMEHLLRFVAVKEANEAKS